MPRQQSCHGMNKISLWLDQFPVNYNDHLMTMTMLSFTWKIVFILWHSPTSLHRRANSEENPPRALHHHALLCIKQELVCWETGGCFTNVSRAVQNNISKIYNTRNRIHSDNFKLKLCTCAQSMALGKHTKFQLEILMRSTISAIHKFQDNILESSWSVTETTPRSFFLWI